MGKTLIIAWREFIATIATKGFVLGIVLPPVLIAGVMVLMPRLMSKAAPKIEGEIVVIDRSGRVGERMKQSFTPEAIAASMAAAAVRQGAVPDGGAGLPPVDAASGVTMRLLDPGSDVDAERSKVLVATGGGKGGGADSRLAVVVIPADVVEAGAGAAGGGGTPAVVEVLHAPKLDFRWIEHINRAVGRAVVDTRLSEGGLDAAKIRGLMAPPMMQALAVTKEGDVRTNEATKLLLPGAFMLLLWISVFTAGQYLLTSTIEEKSSRVMEVILSAASPMQVLSGKIVGQAAVGMLILGSYAAAGLAGLVSYSMLGLIDPTNLVYLVVYFLIAFASIACLFAAVGSAVSDMREAQSLIGPLMIVVMIPMMLWFPILHNPNSVFAQVCSFVPPISPFIMVLRLAGSEPVPVWQIPASMIFGVVTVVVLAWAAAKIFRIGILMYGKPPDFRTLIKWVRMA
ncbi:MAG: ABC transporter permease [Phycisphaeraceae bacterium]|nr:MAG: ABC transporter permease [Phycisphaeraceae bacterium]